MLTPPIPNSMNDLPVEFDEAIVSCDRNVTNLGMGGMY